MTGLTDIRDRTLVMLRALGVEPNVGRMRTVEKYVRWVDRQVSDAHIDGRAMDREIAGGHEMVITHDCDGAVYTAPCATSPTERTAGSSAVRAARIGLPSYATAAKRFMACTGRPGPSSSPSRPGRTDP